MTTSRITALLGFSALSCLSVMSVAVADEVPPPWAYGFADPPARHGSSRVQASAAAPAGNTAAPPDEGLKSAPGSAFQFTASQIRDRFGPADWYPGDHPPMPDIVARGRKPDVIACALCHYPNGKGRPENASIAGLPVPYFIAQMNSFRDGTRKSADPRKTNTGLMAAAARAMTDEEIRVAAEYFGSMQWSPWVRVVETERVPKTKLSSGMFVPTGAGTPELLGERILEVPEDVEAVEVLRSPRVGFVAYVPVGSIMKGKDLVTTGAGRTVPCGTCHGRDLNGTDTVPGIAGRSPSYLVRQMFDMKAGTRDGAGSESMKPVVAKLSTADMLAIAAYAASLSPRGTARPRIAPSL